VVLAAGLVVLAGCATSPGGTRGECVPVVAENGARNGRCLPIAPHDRRVDTGTPVFSRPTEFTNPLHPSTTVDQAIYGGQVSGAPFRTEVTLLPAAHKTIRLRGRDLPAVTVQYFALAGGRIQEVAIDRFAQADDGSVWYLGEDVFDYKHGVVADTEGTWMAGAHAPPAMIMPARPAVGAVYRPENAPGVVFEEVTVTSAGVAVRGPSGPVTGAITVEELHMDGSRETKTFAPGYGEFATGEPGGDLEAISFALPTDAATPPVPSTVDALGMAVRGATDAIVASDWPGAATAAAAVATAWAAARPSDVPLELFGKQMDRDVKSLTDAVAAHDAHAARDAGLRVSQNTLDLRSRHQPVPVTDRERLALWAYQVGVDAAAGDRDAVRGDHACLKWTFDRIRATVRDPAATQRALDAVGTAAGHGDLPSAAAHARELGGLL